jgi:hypothetical protein
MPQPSTLPRWADDVTGDTTRVIEPPSGKKDVGWATQEKPAAQHANWLFNIIYQWIAWLASLPVTIFDETWEELVPATSGHDAGGGAAWTLAAVSITNSNPSPNNFYIPLFTKVGEKISVQLAIKTPGTVGVMHASLQEYEDATETFTSVGDQDSVATSALQFLTLATEHTVLAGHSYFIIVDTTDPSAVARTVYDVRVTHKHV